ncbi:acyl carrier protein [Enhygromyxa salina]|uniref:acyl carrier protein n=1 Tax=Enhygromyxa salina TaxID=215803 RepID=UPI0015E6B661|nr:phosphopantetheine-binding protein [Enhygromyxa salina]
MALIEELTNMIAHKLDVRIDEADITPTVPLLEGGLLLDSMILFELITLIEQRYEVVFPSDGLNTENFANLTVLAGHVNGLIAAKAGQGGRG